jgi:hypothetical protein
MSALDWRKALLLTYVLVAAAGAQTVWNGVTSWEGNTPNQAAIVAGNYVISTPEQLAELAFLVNNRGNTLSGKKYTLANDIALNATDQAGWQASAHRWVAIGNGATPFQGTFDGGGFVVRGVYIDGNSDYQGLFGNVGRQGSINKLRVAESVVKGKSYVGGLVGSDSGNITDSYSTASVDGAGSYVGGLAGAHYRGAITGSYATGDVHGTGNYVGGLVGFGDNDTVRVGYATGNVTGGGSYIGGLVGRGSGYIINACATGDVAGSVTGTGSEYVGGLAGRSEVNNIANSYAAGSVVGKRYVGGLVGEKYGAAIKNCYSAGQVTGTSDVGGLAGSVGVAGSATTITYGYYRADAVAARNPLGIPKDSVYMKSDEFVSVLNVAAYALKNNKFKENANKWFISPGQYPKLSIDSVTVGVFAACFSGGGGTEAAPYGISTPQQLENLAVYVNCGADLSGANGFFRLRNDIMLNDTTGWRLWGIRPDTALRAWTAIGQQPRDTNTTRQAPVRFNGTFDGGGFVIGGVYINRGDARDTMFDARYQGLFGLVEKTGTTGGGAIKNLGVICSYIKGYCYVGGLAGWNSKGTVTRSFVRDANMEATGGINGAGGIGGLAGLSNGGGVIINSYVEKANVMGVINMAGGLLGWNAGGSRVSYCHAGGGVTVNVTGDDVGGLIGRNDGSAVRDSYASADVTATGEAAFGIGGNVIGGLVGMNFNAAVTKCYAVGTVSGNSSVGGLVGARLSEGRIDSSYYRIDSATVINDFGAPRADNQMREINNYQGWNFTTVWAQDPESRSYPYLGMVRAPKPEITRHPVGAWIEDMGATYTLSVTATGGALSYQWYSNTVNRNSSGTKIAGATDATYIPPTDRDTLLFYYVVVTNTSTAAVPDSVAGLRAASVASDAAKIRVGNYPDAVQSPERVIPAPGGSDPSAAVSPPPALTARFAAGPNPAGKSSGAVNFYRQGKRVANATLSIYDASGNAVKRITITDQSGARSPRKVGAWNLTDANGRLVPEGAYLVRGTVAGTDGKRERVSVVVAVVR